MLHLTLRQLDILSAVARQGSTVAAADAVGLSQSATSAALQQLETGLGVQLFERVGRHLVLNDAGRALLPQALSLLEQAQAIEQAFGPQGAGLPVRLRVAASTTVGSYVLPSVLAALARSHPHISVDVRIGNTREVAQAVEALEVDVGLIEGSSHWAGLAVQRWMQRMAAIGHGQRQDISAEEALLEAAAALPAPLHVPVESPTVPEASGLCLGQTVTVTPEQLGHGTSVTGLLVSLLPHRLCLRLHSERCGELHVHFPRTGYRVKAAPTPV